MNDPGKVGSSPNRVERGGVSKQELKSSSQGTSGQKVAACPSGMVTCVLFAMLEEMSSSSIKWRLLKSARKTGSTCISFARKISAIWSITTSGASGYTKTCTVRRFAKDGLGAVIKAGQIEYDRQLHIIHLIPRKCTSQLLDVLLPGSAYRSQ